MRSAAAALVAIACWAGLAVQFASSYANIHHIGTTLWVLARFFTTITNLLAATVMTGVAIGKEPSPRILGGLTLAMILVGVVYAFLLQGLQHLAGPALVADFLLHKVTPILMLLWWLLFAPRARLSFSAPFWWAVYPLAYFAYVVGRARWDHHYPYPFIDISKLGWLQVALNAGGIALAFILAGFALVWIDSWRPLGQSGGKR